jgi:transcriptional regulator with XRE-family HTH domain
MTTNTLAQKIIDLRSKAEINQQELALILEISQNRISRFENDLARPSNQVTQRLVEFAKMFDIEITLEDMLSTSTGDVSRRRGNKKTTS